MLGPDRFQHSTPLCIDRGERDKYRPPSSCLRSRGRDQADLLRPPYTTRFYNMDPSAPAEAVARRHPQPRSKAMNPFPFATKSAALNLLLLPAIVCAGDEPTSSPPAKSSPSTAVRSDLEALSKAPAVFPAENLQAEGVKAFYYEGAKYHGKPTRVFAYYGVPKIEGAVAWKKFPAMVLIHGGGGTAFDRWVKLWNSRGYAAIAMDLCGCVPVRENSSWKRHEHGGPPGWDA